NKDEAFQGVIVSRRMNTLTEYQEPEIFFNDIISSSINHDFGTSPGGGGSYSLQNGSPYYPMDCNGYVIVSIKLVPYPCGCENHMPWECNSCPNSPAGYDEIPYYYCQEYPNLGGDNPDNPTYPSNPGGPASPNPEDTSITAMIKPEECKERIVGDLNRDCQLSPYETCLLGGNSQEVCDCVAAGGELIDCIEEVDCNTSKEDLKLTFPNISDNNAEILANTINLYGIDFGINTNYKLRHFLSQIAHETGGLGNLNRSENLNYTTSSRLLTIFSKYFSYTDLSKANPDEYIGNPEKIGNLVYCCRMGNGNVESGEGYKYRGRGLIQLTGKSNYQAFQNYYNETYSSDTIDIINNPDLISDDVEMAILSAMWYFKAKVINKTLLKSDLNEPVREVTKKVNGGRIGLSDRITKYNNCLLHIDCI
ncbi:glycoside hydrolase family 19 protein, partial [Flavobacterium sp.]|uniref:glycoside hydrolase family 19 protein n=1 Tax=Flavobacterium sp. TaxID=239 RepID=UPI0022C97639